MIMLNHNHEQNQLPKEIMAAFKELKVSQHLKKAGFTKRFGFSCRYLFQIVFCLVFYQKNWFRLLESSPKELFPGKDAVYRFLNYARFSWRNFLSRLSGEAVKVVAGLTSKSRVKVFIIDDSAYERNRSKKVELLARLRDHAKNCYYLGFRMLTLGWSDGHTFIPLDFSLLSSQNSRINGVSKAIDKRTCGYKRRLEALLPAPEIIPNMLDRALAQGVSASYVLMDSWYTYAPLIAKIKQRGLDVIGMVKATNQRYRVGGRLLDLKGLYQAARPVLGGRRDVLRTVIAQLVPDIAVKVVFVGHRANPKEWLAILSTDLSLSEEEIIRIYGIRWDIETFFKCTKSLLRLQKEFKGLSYDMQIAHTTIVFSRYIILAWQHRKNTDERTFGGLFFEWCEEVKALDWTVALKQLLEILNELAGKASFIGRFVKSQIQQWIANLPSSIKACLPNLCCEG